MRPHARSIPSPEPVSRRLAIAPRNRDSKLGARESTTLWMALCLPSFSLEALKAGDPKAQPTAVISTCSSKPRVVVSNDRARKGGVEPGMLLSAAYGLVPELCLWQRDEQAEAEALQGLAAWCMQFTSLVSIVEAKGLLLEVGGSLSLFGGLGPISAKIQDGIHALGYTVEQSVAPTPLAAWWLARSGVAQAVTSQASLAARLARIPLIYLDLPERTLEALHDMGLESFGDVCRLPRDGLARRLGPAFVDLIDRAMGKTADLRTPYQSPPSFSRRLPLPSEVQDVEALLFALRRLVLELAGYLTARASGATELVFEIGFHAAKTQRISIELVKPSREPHHLLSLIRERLQRVSLVEPANELRLIVVAKRIQSLAPSSPELFGNEKAECASWQTLVERLSARLTNQCVLGLDIAPDHRPERAWCHEVVAGKKKDRNAPRLVPASTRPLWLLDAPRPLKMIGAEPWLGSVLELGPGPERIESGWWDGEDIMRDYYVAKSSSGQKYWIFRNLRSPRQWYLHGIFS